MSHLLVTIALLTGATSRPELVSAIQRTCEELDSEGGWEKAVALIDGALPVVADDATLTARLQLIRGSMLLSAARRKTGRFDLAQTALEAARATAEKATDPKLKGQVVNELGMVPYWNKVLRNQGTFDTAKALFEEAEKALHAAGDLQGEARALFRQGLVAQFTNRLDDALALLNRSRVIAEKLGDKKLLAEDHRHLGAAYDLKKDPRQALVHFEKSLAYRRALGGTGGLAPALQTVADTRYALSKADKTVGPMLEQALALATEQKDLAYVAAIEVSLAKSDLDSARSDSAAQRLKRAIAAARAIEDQETLGEAQALLDHASPDAGR